MAKNIASASVATRIAVPAVRIAGQVSKCVFRKLTNDRFTARIVESGLIIRVRPIPENDERFAKGRAEYMAFDIKKEGAIITAKTAEKAFANYCAAMTDIDTIVS